MATIAENSVILRLILKNDEYKKELKKSTESTENLEKSVKSLGDSLNNDMKEKQIKVVSEELTKLEKNVVSLTDKQKKQTESTKSLKKSTFDLIKDFKVFGVSIGDISEKFSSVKDRLGETANGIKGTGGAFSKFNQILKLSVIGIILTVVTGLVAIFSKFQPAIDLVEKSMAALNAVFNVAVDRIARLTLGIGKILSGDFSAGFDEIKDSAKGLTKELTDTAKAAFALQQRAIELRGAQRDLRVEISKQRGEIEKNRIEADRETNDGIKGINRRKKAIQNAIDLELGLEKQRTKLAKEALRIHDDEVARLGVLGEENEVLLDKRAELQIELNDVIEDGNSKRAADLLTLQSIEKESVQLSKERREARQKEFEAQEAITKKVIQNIQDLQNALIGKSEARAAAETKTAAKRTIDRLVGSKEEIKKQTDLINELLKRELERISFSGDDVQLLESDFLTKQIESLTKKEPLKLDLKNVVTFENEDSFGEKLGEFFDPDSEQNAKLREGLSALQEITSSIFAADDKATEAKLENIDRQIDASEDRIKRAVEGGKEGSEELIKIEEARIEKLEKARQESLEAQQRQAKIENALAATSALVNAVPLVLKLFSEGGLVGGLAGIASVIASIATLRAAVQKSTPTFHDGTSYADETGKGTGGKLKRSEFMAKLERGEMVIPKGDSERLRGLGFKHTDILELAESTREKGVISLHGDSSNTKELIDTNNTIIEQNGRMLRYLKNLKTEVILDERGLSIRQMKLQSKIKKRR